MQEMGGGGGGEFGETGRRRDCTEDGDGPTKTQTTDVETPCTVAQTQHAQKPGKGGADGGQQQRSLRSAWRRLIGGFTARWPHFLTGRVRRRTLINPLNPLSVKCMHL